ncbi:RING finger protein 10 [Coccinella septempunctata]|uniref:RING finger protein 10 n=1 Tax=Coccinella septempunctata TaxID=41139 RepID=UPI001D07201E|nr:RING finger protein 10 [Coccinella septempunctata]
MDKKSARSVQPLAKGANFDKKTQDNNGKSLAKGGYRREPASGSLSVKPEVPRKSFPRSKTSDKRPRPRGQQDAVARDETSSLENQLPELGSAHTPGGKKANINHLTNFTYAPRNGVQRENGNKKYKNGNHCVKRHKYVKEHFLQANCQFVVNTSGDYKQHLSNPDAIVDWNYIEQINLQVNDFPLCPICRCTPSAAKITRCGHIFCWSCFLHYLDLSDNSYQKCPICFQNVYEGDLKSVIIIPHNTFNIGDTITFKLMKRNENSLTPYPAEQQKISNENSLIHFSEDEPSKMYRKLLLAQNSDICSIIDREKTELERQLLDAEDSEVCFIEKATNYNREREAKVLGDRVNEMGLSESPPNVTLKGIGKASNPTEDDSESQMNPKYIYFYQASDGQHIYIHSLNVKMLKHTYGSLEYAPTTITAKILSKESDYMSEEYRKCFKYLAHLPVTCPFETMEIELDNTVVTQETLDFFNAQLEERKRRRVKKAKEEKIREMRIAEEEDRKIFKRYPETHIPLESTEQFPSFGSPPISGSDIHAGIEQNEPGSSSWECSGPSFAKMAATVRTKSNPWPGLRSPSVAIPTSSSKMTSLSDISGRRRYNSNCTATSDEQDGGIDQEFVPESRVTIGDAIAQALHKASRQEQTGSSGCSEKGKKKKAKRTLLMSNSSFFGYS